MNQDNTKNFTYDAFISYRHVDPDRQYAKWLHKALETYKVPGDLVQKGYPSKIKKIFRDEEELPASSDLSKEIDSALESSRFLIVVSSPRIIESIWCDAEVKKFRELGRHDKIIALLIEGEPSESFLPSLCEIRHQVKNDDGTTTEKIEIVEPLAADVRPSREESQRELKSLAKLRILACILGCKFDDLRKRELRRKQRKMAIFGTLMAFLVIVFASLTVFALRERDRARDAETLAHQNKKEALEALALNRQEHSKTLYDHGEQYLDKGFIEEGLSFLSHSLKVWPENKYSRDRLLYEIFHRRWLTRQNLATVPLMKTLKDENYRTYQLSDTGHLQMFISVGDKDEADDQYFVLKENSWEKTSKFEISLPEYSHEKVKSVGSTTLKIEELEGPNGFQNITITNGKKTIKTHGLARFSEDGSKIAVAGFAETQQERYFSEGQIYFNIYETETLQNLFNTSYLTTKFSDIHHIQWDGTKVLIVSKDDDREYFQVDVVNLNSGSLMIHNSIIPVTALFKQITIDAHSMEDEHFDASSLVSLKNGELKVFSVWGHPKTNKITSSRYSISSSVYQPPEKTEKVVIEPPIPDDSKFHSVHEGSGLSAQITQRGVLLRNKDGEIIRKIRPVVLTGEGGRHINEVKFSPDGHYLLVKGFSAGGGVDDWEIYSKEGDQILPVCFPREYAEAIYLPYNMMDFFGKNFKGWTQDGKFLVFHGPETYTKKEGKVKKPDHYLPFIFCETPPPGEFLDVVNALIKIDFHDNGQFLMNSSENFFDELKKFKNKYAKSEYAEFFGKFLPVK